MKLKQQLLRASTVIALAAALAGCGSGANAPAPTPTQTVTALQEDQFGVVFGTDFRNPANSEPFVVFDGDIIAISLTAEPVTIN